DDQHRTPRPRPQGDGRPGRPRTVGRPVRQPRDRPTDPGAQLRPGRRHRDAAVGERTARHRAVPAPGRRGSGPDQRRQGDRHDPAGVGHLRLSHELRHDPLRQDRRGDPRGHGGQPRRGHRQLDGARRHGQGHGRRHGPRRGRPPDRRGDGPGRQERLVQDRRRDHPAAHGSGLRGPDHHRTRRVRPRRRRPHPGRARGGRHARADRGRYRRPLPGGRLSALIGTLGRVTSTTPAPEPTRAHEAAPGRWTTPIRGRVAVAALAWVLLYSIGFIVVVVVGMLGLEADGVVRFGLPVVALTVLAGSAVAGLVAVRVHLLGRRGLGWSDVGFCRLARWPAVRLWQFPAVLVAGVVASMLVLPLFGAGAAGEDGDDVVAELLGCGPLIAVLGLVSVAALVPVFEEVVFRGIVLPAARARFRVVPGIALAGAVFAAVHMLPPALPYLLVVGIALCAMAEWYRSIVPGIVLHGLNNAMVVAGVVAA